MEDKQPSPPLFVIAYLQNPREKFWGVLHESTPAGVWISGTGLRNLEEWLNFGIRQNEPPPAFTPTFLPMHRLEKMTVDENEGDLPAFWQTIQDRAGVAVESLFPQFSQNRSSHH